MLTELLILLVIRTQRPFFTSRPSRYLIGSIVAIGLLTVLLPYTPFGELLSLTPLPWSLLVLIATITGAYLAASELAKHVFYRHVSL